MRHLLVTNDFPPKVGGIQSYLWELWRRLAPEEVTVLTARHPGAAAFDARQPFRVARTAEPVLLPHPGLVRRIRQLVAETGAGLVVIDPALPLGLVGPRLGMPYAVVLHGAEVSVPGRLPAARSALAHVLRRADRVIAAGAWPAGEGRRAAGTLPPVAVVPPGVDTRRFSPLGAVERDRARDALGLPVGAPLVLSVSRLVPRKGMDTLVEAAALLARDRRRGLCVAIAGTGRDRARLERLVRQARAPVRFLGAVEDEALPALYACADVFAMLCRARWGGLEQEGFGIVFLEAAASGVAAVAGDSGGAHEAVLDGQTGLVVGGGRSRAERAQAAAAAIGRLLDDDALRRRWGCQARRHAETAHDYDVLARRLAEALA